MGLEIPAELFNALNQAEEAARDRYGISRSAEPTYKRGSSVNYPIYDYATVDGTTDLYVVTDDLECSLVTCGGDHAGMPALCQAFLSRFDVSLTASELDMSNVSRDFTIEYLIIGSDVSPDMAAIPDTVMVLPKRRKAVQSRVDAPADITEYDILLTYEHRVKLHSYVSDVKHHVYTVFLDELHDWIDAALSKKMRGKRADVPVPHVKNIILRYPDGHAVVIRQPPQDDVPCDAANDACSSLIRGYSSFEDGIALFGDRIESDSYLPYCATMLASVHPRPATARVVHLTGDSDVVSICLTGVYDAPNTMVLVRARSPKDGAFYHVLDLGVLITTLYMCLVDHSTTSVSHELTLDRARHRTVFATMLFIHYMFGLCTTDFTFRNEYVSRMTGAKRFYAALFDALMLYDFDPSKYASIQDGASQLLSGEYDTLLSVKFTEYRLSFAQLAWKFAVTRRAVYTRLDVRDSRSIHPRNVDEMMYMGHITPHTMTRLLTPVDLNETINITLTYTIMSTSRDQHDPTIVTFVVSARHLFHNSWFSSTVWPSASGSTPFCIKLQGYNILDCVVRMFKAMSLSTSGRKRKRTDPEKEQVVNIPKYIYMNAKAQFIISLLMFFNTQPNTIDDLFWDGPAIDSMTSDDILPLNPIRFVQPEKSDVMSDKNLTIVLQHTLD